MIAAYLRQWPEGWPRTAAYARVHGRFSTRRNSHTMAQDLTVADGVERVLIELSRFGIGREDIVISTNLKTRLDGLPRSDQKAPDDPSVAVYLETRKGQRKVMAIDPYLKVADNLAAVAATLDAMRAIERHGGAQILDRAFTGCRYCRRHLNSKFALTSLARAINATEAPGSNDCSTRRRLNSVGKFGRLYAPPAARAFNVFSTLASAIIWWTPNYPNPQSAVHNGPDEPLTHRAQPAADQGSRGRGQAQGLQCDRAARGQGDQPVQGSQALRTGHCNWLQVFPALEIV